MQRLTVRFEGRVQGVGFRLTVADLARSYDVTGRVCNVADGSVQLIAEGEAGVLSDFHQAILLRMDRNIIRDRTEWEESDSRKWSDFAIGVDKLR